MWGRCVRNIGSPHTRGHVRLVQVDRSARGCPRAVSRVGSRLVLDISRNGPGATRGMPACGYASSHHALAPHSSGCTKS